MLQKDSHITEADIRQFYEYVEKLGLKHPVAAISKKTKYSRGNVSEVLNRVRPPSKEFILKFYKEFPKSSGNVPREINLEEALKGLQEWQAGVDAGFVVLIQEIAPILAEANGKTISGVISQLKKDIDSETSNRLALLKKEG